MHNTPLTNAIVTEEQEITETNPALAWIACVVPGDPNQHCFIRPRPVWNHFLKGILSSTVTTAFHITVAPDRAKTSINEVQQLYTLLDFGQLLSDYIVKASNGQPAMSWSCDRGRVKTWNKFRLQLHSVIQASPPSQIFPLGNCDAVIVQSSHGDQMVELEVDPLESFAEPALRPVISLDIWLVLKFEFIVDRPYKIPQGVIKWYLTSPVSSWGMWFLSTVLPCVALASARHALMSRDDTSLSKLTLSGPASLPIDATPPLNPALASFSIETTSFEEFMGNQSYPNQFSQNLFENLKERTGVSAEVRIGGITADSTFWDPNQEAALYNFIDSRGALINTTLGPQFWNTVKLLPQGTKIVMTLDLKSLNYTGTLGMAEAAWMGLGSRRISRFESESFDSPTDASRSDYTPSSVGNEPDQYYLDLDAQTYTAIWEPWTINISKALGIDYPEFQIGATAQDPFWPYNTPQADAQFDCPRIHSVRVQLGPDAFVIGEFNSVSCGGRANVSNTFGQAMWLLDTTLYAASINVSRLYVHQGGPPAHYNLWYPVDSKNGPIQVFPSYSAYLFVAEAIGYSRSLRLSNIFPGRQANGSSITTAGGDPSAGQISVYGFWDETSVGSYDYPTKIALLNLELYNQTDSYPRPNIAIDVSAYLRKKTQEVIVKRLTAPGADVLSAELTTWAGQTFASGVAEGNIVEEKVYNGQVVVEASSAALVYW
ncbi:uncharacterized protein BJ212DRAFT_1575402 [Suillus subaureus]|uniref:Beta-glucuronidase C-terminal domain-containing protein n=1 Tax=Suillus subaureus TaxID=48587 RepID=A0A9P7JGI4_9AGAM|nr:uncharacterized protein BJ212DRAFT_1575402 [Suillus subaureus]KAG1821171.1 hypothetical protein BJ212DRAFT_1575402 [Suillus subaureus]